MANVDSVTLVYATQFENGEISISIVKNGITTQATLSRNQVLNIMEVFIRGLRNMDNGN
jgi:hypothetical protein